MQNKVIAIIACGILIAGFLLPLPLNVWTAPVSHQNSAHLALNVWSLYALISKACRHKHALLIVVVCYAVGVLATFLSPAQTIGASSMIFCLWGLLLIDNLNLRNILFTGSLTILSFLPGIATIAHIIALALGIILASIAKLFTFIWRNV